MIQGYPDQPSVRAGEKVRLHVSTDNPHQRFRVDFYRQGERLVKMGSLDAQTGHDFARLRHYEPWGWPGYDFQIPDDWPSGAYIANLIETDKQGEPIDSSEEIKADGRNAKALFVVKSNSPGHNAQILYKLSLTTYHAYNYSGGGNLYVGEWFTDPVTKKKVNKVSTHRPGGGTGGAIPRFNASNSLSNSFDPYDEGSPRQTFAHWDVPFIAWLEKNGYRVDYCTDLDLHEERDLLTSYRLLLSVGHDEYWSDQMRAHVEAFIRQGGNVAFFSGNTCWWHIEFCDFTKCADGELHPTAFARDFQTWKTNPENSLTGVSYRNAGGWWTGEREPVGYTVQNADHWVYEGTGLRNEDVFGADEHLVGYECDGALFTRDNHDFPVPTGMDHTPSDFVILGIGELADRGWQFETRENHNQDPHAATMGLYTRGGIVFTAATTDWTRVLTINKHVDRITRNVLNRLKSHAVRIVGPLSSGDGIPVVQADIKFQVDATNLPNQENLKYKWTISGSAAIAKSPLDQPVFETVMPSAPTPVTVTVEIENGAGYEAFGTSTFTPLSQQDYLQFLLWNHLRELATLVQSAFNKDTSRLVFPLWDPSIGRALTPSVQDLQDVVLGSQQLTRLAEQLKELAEKLIEYQR
ncbi:MAG TPA: N,N-dimethylformamidase beta subunit family domain-containing protein [Pyrinomonadaceae bacterium]|nr:N,N-dimethylformamidase beta subunit family domain-containing protein [Pyrinomonadaceae bacterium]